MEKKILLHYLSENYKIFGGFTDAEWDESNTYKKGNKGFLFSVNNNQIYYNINSNYNIFCNKYYGPSFGFDDLIIKDNCNKENNFDSTNYMNSAYETLGNEYILAGIKFFKVLDYSVYQIEFE